MWSGYLSYKIENLEDLTDQHLTKKGTQPETGRQKQIWRPKENTFPTVQIIITQSRITLNFMPLLNTNQNQTITQNLWLC